MKRYSQRCNSHDGRTSGIRIKLAALLTLGTFGCLTHAQAPVPNAPSATSADGVSGNLNPATSRPGTAQSQPTPTQAPAKQPPVQPSVQSTPGGDNSPYTIRTTVNEVNLIFTVSDRHGRFIKDLKQSDFALLDDQKAPAQIFRFAQETNLPLRVGLLIDASTSIRQRFQFEQQAAVEFLLQILRPKSDKAFVMGFDATPELKQDWTNNEDLLQTGINKLSPGGGTALFDALYTACHDKLLDTTRGQEPVRKAIILVSDGEDNQSRAYLDDAIKMCQRAETIVYAISTNTSPTRDKGDEVLKKIAEATGGVAFYPDRIEDIANGFRNIQDELRSQYALGYKPADFRSDGAFRTIYLFCLDRRYVVRTKKGYFAPRQ